MGRVRVEGNLARGEAEVVRGRRIEITAWQVQQPVREWEHLRRGGQVVRVVQPCRWVGAAVEVADRGERVEHVGNAGAVWPERHELTLGAAPLRTFEES